VSFDLRRDIGIWAALLAIFHTGFGLTVHLRGRMWMYFFKRLHPLAIQKSTFGFANYVGLAATLIFVMLLAISNDFSIRSLGSRSWKSIQRWTYAAFGLTVAHGIAFQIVEKRRIPWVIIFAGMATVALVLQFLGLLRVRMSDRARRN
jgi:sulfoxide reductase heme-binding subunit YedZ